MKDCKLLLEVVLNEYKVIDIPWKYQLNDQMFLEIIKEKPGYIKQSANRDELEFVMKAM